MQPFFSTCPRPSPGVATSTVAKPSPGKSSRAASPLAGAGSTGRRTCPAEHASHARARAQRPVAHVSSPASARDKACFRTVLAHAARIPPAPPRQHDPPS
eukprot:6174989-Alexandrium_andersonii.AAC.1